MRQTNPTIIERIARREVMYCEFCASPYKPDSRGNCAACGGPAKFTTSLELAGAETGPVKGFDISKWSVITNAAQALAGMTFAIIRARDGIRDDTSWSVNKELAKQLPFWGAYAFFNPR